MHDDRFVTQCTNYWPIKFFSHQQIIKKNKTELTFHTRYVAKPRVVQILLFIFGLLLLLFGLDFLRIDATLTHAVVKVGWI